MNCNSERIPCSPVAGLQGASIRTTQNPDIDRVRVYLHYQKMAGTEMILK